MYATHNYYNEEKKLYSEAYSIHVKNAKATKIINKLCKHYKVVKPAIRYWGQNQSGSANGWKIRFSNNPSVGLILHEFAHYGKRKIMEKEGLVFDNDGTSHHGTHFQACINFVNLYAQKKDYWKNMYNEKMIIKEEEKPFEVIIEDGAARIVKAIDDKEDEIKEIEEKIEGYKKRLQYFTKLYGTKIKKAHRSIGAHKRVLAKIRKNLTPKPDYDRVMVANIGEEK